MGTDPAGLERKRKRKGSKRKEGRGLGTEPEGRAAGIGRPWVRARESGQDQRPTGGGAKAITISYGSQENTECRFSFRMYFGPTRALAPQHRQGTTNNKHNQVWCVLLVPPERLLFRDSHVKRALVQVAVEIFGIVRPWTRLSLCRLSVVGCRLSYVDCRLGRGSRGSGQLL